MLDVDGLGLSPSHPMMFSSGSSLVQMALAKEAGAPWKDADLVVNGMFLVKNASWQRKLKVTQYTEISLSEIEFPVWLILSPLGVLCLRGELIYPLGSGAEASKLYTEHPVRLTCIRPQVLADFVDRVSQRIDGAMSGFDPLGMSDIRYYSRRNELSGLLGLNMNLPFSVALASSHPERLPVYESAIGKDS
jgi:hypothetical protein